MNEERGRVLREWIVFLLGVGIILTGAIMLIVLLVVWIARARPPDPGLLGFACVMLGYGNILLSTTTNGKNGKNGK